jgi:probable HAF family extracellular repeat protein
MGRIVGRGRAGTGSRLMLAVAVLAGVVAWPAASGADGGRRCRLAGARTTEIGPASDDIYPADINGHGEVVGTVETPSGLHSFRWRRGTMVDLTPSLQGATTFVATNERGQVLIDSYEGGPPARTVLLSHGRTISIDDPDPASANNAYAFNERGQVLLEDDLLWDRGTTQPIIAPPEMDLVLVPEILGNGGHVAGRALGRFAPGEPPPPNWGFVWRAGRFRLVEIPAPYVLEQVVAVDSAGRVLVNAQAPDGGWAALLWDGGEVTEIGGLTDGPGRSTWARDMNDRGQVVGWSMTASGTSHAFLWHRGETRDLHTLGPSWSDATAISETGYVTGRLQVRGGLEDHSFLWACGRMVDLGALGTPYSVPQGINNKGQVVSLVPTSPFYRAMLSTPVWG